MLHRVTALLSRRKFFPALGICGIAAVAGVSSLEAADAIALTPNRKVTSATRVTVSVKAKGKLNFSENGETTSSPMTLSAAMEYDERMGEDSKDRARLVRLYRKAQAEMTIGEGRLAPRLPADKRLVAVELQTGPHGSGAEIAAVGRPMTREELDLLTYPASAVLLESLLPGDPVRIGDRWKISPDVAARLLAIDVAGNSELEGALSEVDPGKSAKLLLFGRVEGAIGGVSTDIDVEGELQFDIAAGLVRVLNMKIKEKRNIGHVGPGLDVECQVDMMIAPPGNSALRPEVAAAIDWEALPKELLYVSPSGRFQLAHPRTWHVVEEHSGGIMLRMLDRGELVAQCNIALTTPAEPDKPLTLERFEEAVRKTLGERFQKVVLAREFTTDGGLNVLSVIAEGNVQGLAIQWHYYLASDETGNQASLVFTLEPHLLERIGGSHMAMIRSLRLAGGAATAGNRPDRK